MGLGQYDGQEVTTAFGYSNLNLRVLVVDELSLLSALNLQIWGTYICLGSMYEKRVILNAVISLNHV